MIADPAFESHAQVLAHMLRSDHEITHEPISRLRHTYFGLGAGPLWDRVKQILGENHVAVS